MDFEVLPKLCLYKSKQELFMVANPSSFERSSQRYGNVTNQKTRYDLQVDKSSLVYLFEYLNLDLDYALFAVISLFYEL